MKRKYSLLIFLALLGACSGQGEFNCDIYPHESQDKRDCLEQQKIIQSSR